MIFHPCIYAQCFWGMLILFFQCLLFLFYYCFFWKYVISKHNHLVNTKSRFRTRLYTLVHQFFTRFHILFPLLLCYLLFFMCYTVNFRILILICFPLILICFISFYYYTLWFVMSHLLMKQEMESILFLFPFSLVSPFLLFYHCLVQIFIIIYIVEQFFS